MLGALAGALASYVVAREKAKSDAELETMRLQANVIATERLRWLQDMRQRLSTFYEKLDMQYNWLKRPNIPGNQPATQDQLDDMSAEVMGQCNMISLMLNPGKPHQAELRATVQEALAFILSAFHQVSSGERIFNDSQYAAIKRRAFDALTEIGVQTWRQVKALT